MMLYIFHVFLGDTVQNWKKEDNGFKLHVISTVAEWICAGCTILYLLLFRDEFSTIDIVEPTIFIRDVFVVKISNEESASRAKTGSYVDNEKY